MAKEYYAYQPTDPQFELNWAEIGSNLINIINDKQRRDEGLASEINKQTREFIKQAEDIPQGESTTIREFGLQFSNDLVETIRLQNQMLKNGDIGVKDFLRVRQNSVDGTDQAFSLLQQYQDVFKKKMDRFKSTDPDNKSQYLEVWAMENVEGFSNFNTSQLGIDPRTGKVFAAKKVLNPKTGLMELSKDPNDRRAVSALSGQLNGEFDYYNVEAQTGKWVEGVGEWSNIIRDIGSRTKAGTIVSVLNPMEKLMKVDGSGKRIVDIDRARALGVPESDLEAMNLYLQAEDDWIEGQSANPFSVSSVLTNNANIAPNGKEYTYTFDKKDAAANPEKILLEPTTLTPIFDKEMNPNAEEQKEVYRQQMRNAIRNKHNVTEKTMTVNDWKEESQASLSRRDSDNKKQDVISNIAKFYYGDKTEGEEAASFIRGINPNIDTIDRNGSSVVVTYLDGRPDEELKFKTDDGTLLSQEEWVVANANFLLGEDDRIPDVNKVFKRSEADLDRQFNEETSVYSSGIKVETEPIDEAFKREVELSIPLDAFVPEKSSTTISNLRGIFATTPGLTGLKVYQGTFSDIVLIDDEDGNRLEELSVDDDNISENTLKDYIQRIAKLANARASIEEKALSTKGKRKTTRKTSERRPDRSGPAAGGTPTSGGTNSKFPRPKN